eukprot:11260266-Alexandrium_andersonii.AAC.1
MRSRPERPRRWRAARGPRPRSRSKTRRPVGQLLVRAARGARTWARPPPRPSCGGAACRGAPRCSRAPARGTWAGRARRSWRAKPGASR